MKKLLFILMLTLFSVLSYAQRDGDMITVSLTDGRTETYQLTGSANVFRTMKMSEILMQLTFSNAEGVTCTKTIPIDNIESIRFHCQSHGQSETAATAIRNMGLGFNLGNTLDAWATGIPDHLSETSRYETCWGQPVVTRAQMQFLKDGGFNAVRLPVTWLQHIDADGNIDESWLQRVQQVVDYITGAGLYCILNVHHDTGSGSATTQWLKADAGCYATSASRYRRIWQQIATRFCDYDHHLLFESFNEILDASNSWTEPKDLSGYTVANRYAQDFVDVVRATGGRNITRNLVINTYSASHSQKTLDNFCLPDDVVAGHLAVQVHSYDPWNWLDTHGAWDDACSRELASMFDRLNRRFVSQGIPCIIGEYGTHGDKGSVTASSSAAHKQAAARQAADMVRRAKALGIATFYWMSIFDGADRNIPRWTLPEVVQAMKQ